MFSVHATHADEAVIQLFTRGTERMLLSFSFTGFQVTPVLQSLYSPVCAAADLFCAGFCRFLHHLGSDQVQRDPHTKRTRGKRHRRGCQGGEHVAPTSHEETHTGTHTKIR